MVLNFIISERGCLKAAGGRSASDATHSLALHCLHPHPSASAYGASGLPQYTTLPSQGAYGYGGNPYAAQAPAAPHLPSYAAPAQGYHPGYASQMYSRPY